MIPSIPTLEASKETTAIQAAAPFVFLAVVILVVLRWVV